MYLNFWPQLYLLLVWNCFDIHLANYLLDGSPIGNEKDNYQKSVPTMESVWSTRVFSSYNACISFCLLFHNSLFCCHLLHCYFICCQLFVVQTHKCILDNVASVVNSNTICVFSFLFLCHCHISLNTCILCNVKIWFSFFCLQSPNNGYRYYI